MAALARRRLEPPVLDAVGSGRPFLGICVGMQMLFDASEEDAGRSRPRRAPGRRPVAAARRQAAADAVEPLDLARPAEPMFAGLGERPWFYFVHSLHGVPDDPSLVVGHVRLRRHGQRRVPLRQRVRHPVPPGEVGRRGPRPARQLRRVRWPVAAVTHDPLPVDRPARRPGRSARARATTTPRRCTATTRSPSPARSAREARAWIHVVDLDAARTGRARQPRVVAAIVGAVAGRAQVQTGGGVRTVDDAGGARRRRRRPGRHGLGGGRRPGAGRRRRGRRPGRRRARPPRAACSPCTAGPRRRDVTLDDALGRLPAPPRRS